MGRNSAIKHYDATPAGQPLELWEGGHGRLPVIVELLKSPWIMRASDLLARDGSAVKRAEEPVAVVWDPDRRCPASFVRNRRTYRIDAVIQVWAAERAWWDRRSRVSRRYWRVLARGGVYDLAYDRVADGWLLIGIQD